MIVSDIVMIGDKIDIYLPGQKKEGESVLTLRYISQLLDFIDEDKAKLLMPITGNRVIPLEIGIRCDLFFYTYKGIYRCRALVTERYKEENLHILVVQFLSDLEKFQRRQYYRLECIKDIECRLVAPEEAELIEKIEADSFEDEEEREMLRKQLNSLQLEWYQATLTDISGGGARFNAPMRYNPGDKIRIDISFEVKHCYFGHELKANVISSIPLNNRPDMFEIRVEFSEITVGQRETIIKFVFEEERKRRKRERGLI